MTDLPFDGHFTDLLTKCEEHHLPDEVFCVYIGTTVVFKRVDGEVSVVTMETEYEQ